MDLHHLFPIFGIKNHLFRLNFSRKHLTNLFFVYATVMIFLKQKVYLKICMKIQFMNYIVMGK